MKRLAEPINGQWVDRQVGPVTRMVFDPHSKTLLPKAPVGRFIAGPLTFAWLCTAANLPGKSVQVALALCFLRGIKKSQTFKVTAEALVLAGCSRQAYYYALGTLETAGLIAVQRSPGARATVTLQQFH